MGFAELGWGVGSLADRRGCSSRMGYSNYETGRSALLRERMSNRVGLTQTPSFAAQAGTVGKPATARSDIGQPGIVDNTVAAVALLLRLAVACILPVTLPRIVLVGRTGRT